MTLHDKCFRFYRLAAKVIVPTLKYSQTIYEDLLGEYSKNKNAWLDLGCGHELLPPWRFEQERSLVNCTALMVGSDYDHNSLKSHKTINHRVRATISYLPFVDESFDLVTSNMVFEHLSEPLVQLREILRILKPGGLLLFHTPNLKSYGPLIGKLIPESLKSKLIWFFQHRKAEDVFPTFYRINTSRQIENIARSVGFKVIFLRFVLSSPQFIMIPPLLIMELLFIRLLMTKFGKYFRPNIMAILRKPDKSKEPGKISTLSF